MPARTEGRGRRARNHEFTLVLEGVDVLEPEHLDAWFEAGCDDATFGEVDGVGFADFARRAPSAPDAILSAIAQIESAVPSVRVIRVEPDDLVSASDIAARLGRSRESVRLLIAGDVDPRRRAQRRPRPSAPVAGAGGTRLAEARLGASARITSRPH